MRGRLELLLDTYLSAATPVQNALGELLTIGDRMAGEMSARIQRNRAVLDGILKDSPVHVLHAEAGWSAILQLPKHKARRGLDGRID